MATTRTYFQKFPSITYNDYVVRDVSARTKLMQYLTESGLALLPYTVKEGERADSIASFYYNDPYYSWAIYLVNGIIDPYSEWPKDQYTFNKYIEDTYGSMEEAMDVIVRYEVDWASDTSMISPAQYDSLPLENKKYWESQFGYNGEIISYFRRELDWVLDNNRLDQVTVVSNASVTSLSNSFSVGERLYQYNYLSDVATKSTIISVDATTDANIILLSYTNSTSYDITFTSGNKTATVKSTKKLLPKALISGTNLPSGTYIKHIINGSHVELSNAPTGAPTNGSTYTVSNPATATLTVQKVDFGEVIFASNATLAATDSFFTYEYDERTNGSFTNGSNLVTNVTTSIFTVGETITVYHGTNTFVSNVVSTNSTHLELSTNANFTGTGTIYYNQGMAYHDEGNYLVGRKNGANVVVLTHSRLDTNAESVDLLSNSQLSINELRYWKSVNAYDDELAKNESRKEILVLDSQVIGDLNDNLEQLLKS